MRIKGVVCWHQSADTHLAASRLILWSNDVTVDGKGFHILLSNVLGCSRKYILLICLSVPPLTFRVEGVDAPNATQIHHTSSFACRCMSMMMRRKMMAAASFLLFLHSLVIPLHAFVLNTRQKATRIQKKAPFMYVFLDRTIELAVSMHRCCCVILTFISLLLFL